MSVRDALGCRGMPAAVHEGSGVYHDVVSSDGLRRLLRYRFDSLDGRLTHTTVLVFGLRAGSVTDEKACQWVQLVPTDNNIYLLLVYRFARLLFGILDVVRIRLPERALLPAFGEAHAAELTETKAAQKFEETLTPERLGRDVLQQIAQDCEDAEHVVRPHTEGFVPFRMLRLLGNDWSGADAPVPETAMVCAYVTHRVYGHEPRFQHARAYAQIVRELVPDFSWCTAEEPEHGAKVHQVDEYPVRRKLVLIAIGLFKVDGEGLT